MVFMSVGDSRHLYNELRFSSSEVRLSFTLDFHLPFQFLGGGEEREASPVVLHCFGTPWSTPRASRKNSCKWGWGAGEEWKGTQLLSMNETVSHGSAKLHEVPVYPC